MDLVDLVVAIVVVTILVTVVVGVVTYVAYKFRLAREPEEGEDRGEPRYFVVHEPPEEGAGDHEGAGTPSPGTGAA
jgi:hypothetical protein